MANAGKSNMGHDTKRGHEGSGATTELEDEVLEKDQVLSNRDKAQHNQERGLDSKDVQTREYKDHSANKRGEDESGKDD